MSQFTDCLLRGKLIITPTKSCNIILHHAYNAACKPGTLQPCTLDTLQPCTLDTLQPCTLDTLQIYIKLTNVNIFSTTFIQQLHSKY